MIISLRMMRPAVTDFSRSEELTSFRTLKQVPNQGITAQMHGKKTPHGMVLFLRFFSFFLKKTVN